MSDESTQLMLGRVLGGLEQNQHALEALRNELLREVANVRDDVKSLKEGLDRQGRELRGEHTKLDVRVTNLEMAIQRVAGGWRALAFAASIGAAMGALIIEVGKFVDIKGVQAVYESSNPNRTSAR